MIVPSTSARISFLLDVKVPIPQNMKTAMMIKKAICIKMDLAFLLMKSSIFPYPSSNLIRTGLLQDLKDPIL